MLLGLISKKIDIFSLGVVFSWAVCDQSPFPEEGNAWNGALRLCTSSSQQFQNLLQKMLNIKPKLRPSLEEVQKDPWFEDKKKESD
mmetsp:Transcript_162096/g.298953  ORF Transcript_162096/g.298953 Transcript_162096/m.298953 type:complete len:86 (-) Transcript_162096:35-292(-)